MSSVPLVGRQRRAGSEAPRASRSKAEIPLTERAGHSDMIWKKGSADKSRLNEEVGEGPVVERVRNRIREIYGPRESLLSEVMLDRFVESRLKDLRPKFSHRQVEIITKLEPVPHTCVPEDVLQKVIDGLIKNAVEATPDEGRIEILVQKKGEGSELVVYDCGVGITDENQRRIFEGFFSTQETMNYSSKRPFDFNAGGKGADLLRMKIFAERYNFKIDMGSARCRYIPNESDLCPGRISECRFCKEREDCFRSGGTAFNVFFPPAPDRGCLLKPDLSKLEA